MLCLALSAPPRARCRRTTPTGCALPSTWHPSGGASALTGGGDGGPSLWDVLAPLLGSIASIVIGGVLALRVLPPRLPGWRDALARKVRAASARAPPSPPSDEMNGDGAPAGRAGERAEAGASEGAGDKQDDDDEDDAGDGDAASDSATLLLLLPLALALAWGAALLRSSALLGCFFAGLAISR